MQKSRQIVVAGGGIAGLTAAIAFARKGFPVRLFERTIRAAEIGAGLQLSPNATRLLDRLGVLDLLRPVAVQPEAIVLRRSADLGELARIPLGEAATRRWGAPYLVAHRADLHAALAARAAQEPEVTMTYGSSVADAAFHPYGVTVSVDRTGAVEEHGALLLVGADGVWSPLRRALLGGASRFSGRVAWRAMLRADDPLLDAVALERDCVTTFVHQNAHLVAYPVRAGHSVNLVAITRAPAPGPGWSVDADIAPLRTGLRYASPALRALLDGAAPWTAWPIHAVDARSGWTEDRGAVLIGDAAHAMTPFAAQGAAAAIEDAWVLAEAVARRPTDMAAALEDHERRRRSRVTALARRASFNEFAWHAGGPVAWVRDRVLRMRGGARLAADLDWIYGYDATAAAAPIN